MLYVKGGLPKSEDETVSPGKAPALPHSLCLILSSGSGVGTDHIHIPVQRLDRKFGINSYEAFNPCSYTCNTGGMYSISNDLRRS